MTAPTMQLPSGGCNKCGVLDKNYPMSQREHLFFCAIEGEWLCPECAEEQGARSWKTSTSASRDYCDGFQHGINSSRCVVAEYLHTLAGDVQQKRGKGSRTEANKLRTLARELERRLAYAIAQGGSRGLKKCPNPLCDGGRVLVEDAGESFLAYCALCKGVGKVALEVAA